MVTLPGNPVSSQVSFEVFVRPALRAALGHPHPDRPVVTARSVNGGPRPPGAGSSAAAVVDAVHGTVREVGGPRPTCSASLARADCLVVVPDDVTELPEGASVEVWLLDA